MTPGEGSVPDEQIEATVKKVIEDRLAGKTKKRKKKVKIRIIANKPKKKVKEEPEELFNKQLNTSNLCNFHQLGKIFPEHNWVREYKGIPGRKYRFDFADLVNKVAVEIQGAVFIYGGHSTGMGITRDCEKLALAILNGWTLFMFTSGQVRSGQAIAWLKEYFEKRL